MIVLALMPNRPRCGVSDYADHLYQDAQCLGSDIVLKKINMTFWNCIKAPFLRADIVHVQHEYSLFGFAGIAGFLLMLYFLPFRLVGRRFATTLHTIYDWDRVDAIFAHRTRLKILLFALRCYGKAYDRLIVSVSDLLIFLSNYSYASFARKFPELKPTRVAVIPIGVYDRVVQVQVGQILSDRLALSVGDFVLTLLGFAFPNKGYHLAIEALNVLHVEYPKLKLLIVSGEPAEGGGGYLGQLKQLVAGYGLADKVIFTGYVPFDDPLFDAVLSRTNCFLYPYLSESATSGSLATTFPARKIYLTSDLEMFRDFSPRVTFNVGDMTDLVNKIKLIINLHPSDLSKNSEMIEEFIQNNNIESMRKRHIVRFHKLLL